MTTDTCMEITKKIEYQLELLTDAAKALNIVKNEYCQDEMGKEAIEEVVNKVFGRIEDLGKEIIAELDKEIDVNLTWLKEKNIDWSKK
ncbi:MAG: hypothetical protein K6T66_07490 [Peptococcaceae bacterium]|nr:hypothetical protein [Peptococcaceae bacterium]